MSDYLTRMAQLSRGEANVVTPRLPGLFAPADDVGLTEAIETGIQQQGETAHQTKAMQVLPAAAVDPGRHQPALPAELSRTEPVRHDATTGQTDKTGCGSRPSVPRHGSLVAEPHNPHAVSPTFAASEPNNNQADSSAAQPDSARQSFPTDMLQALIPPKGEIGVDAAAAPSGRPENGKPDSPPPLVPGYANHQPAPQLLIADLPTAEPAVAQKGTVHINIGRVEVRAQAAAPQPSPLPARPRRESVFTLSEYLTRSGGRS